MHHNGVIYCNHDAIFVFVFVFEFVLKVRGTECNAPSWGDISDCSLTHRGQKKSTAGKRDALEDVILLTAPKFYFLVTALTLDILLCVIMD